MHALDFYQSQTTLSIDDLEETSKTITLYPNPTSKILNIKSSVSSGSSSVELYSIQGKKVFTTQLDNNQSDIDISHLTAGLYLVKVINDTSSFTTKIIKQ